MKEYKFKTNINCGGCVAKVTPSLDANTDIKEWNVDTVNPSKVLTVKTEKLKEDEIQELVQKAGFKAEALV
ncbi:MAG: heavy-metal-associated domain-containing protein [Bacteroidota bacterium]|nr:heavy-metal-associated domain-containing protein [Bacteroidota bacterium]